MSNDAPTSTRTAIERARAVIDELTTTARRLASEYDAIDDDDPDRECERHETMCALSETKTDIILWYMRLVTLLEQQ